MHFGIGILGVFLTGLAVGPAFSAISTYSTLTDWNAAVTSPTTIDFNAINGYISTHTASGVTFTPQGTGFLLAGQSGWYSGCNVRCLATDNSGTNHGIVATYGGVDLLAFGLNLFTDVPGPQPVTVRVFLAGNSTSTPDRVESITSSNTAPAFYGLTSTEAIQKVEITAAAFPVVDNFTISTVLSGGGGPVELPNTDTPEVPTLSYVGIGFMALLYGSRRRARL